MRLVTIRELKINGSRVIDDLKREDAVITKRGKPVATLVPIDEDTIEEFVIAHNPQLLRQFSRAYEEYRKKGGVDLDTIKRKMKSRRG